MQAIDLNSLVNVPSAFEVVSASYTKVLIIDINSAYSTSTSVLLCKHANYMLFGFTFRVYAYVYLYLFVYSYTSTSTYTYMYTNLDVYL